MLAVLDLHTHGFGALCHLQRHLVAQFLRDIGAVANVVRHQHGEDREGQLRKTAADVDPVGREQVDGLLRQVKGVDDLLCAVARGLDKGLVLQEHLGLAHGMDREFVDTVEHGAAEL